MEPNITTMSYQPASQPTMYFIGVTTARSSIMKIFPAWADYLELGRCAIQGMDFAIHDRPERYREAVAFIKSDPLSLGALITTHKIDLLQACRDQFDELDPFADLLGEVSSISKRQNRLIGHAKDPITSGLALEAFLPARHWEKTAAEVFLLGAGGSALAISWHLMRQEHGANQPSRIIVANRSTPRLEEMKRIHERIGTAVPVEYAHTPAPDLSDAILKQLKPGSLVVNATGLGKDAPGSPLTSNAQFPQNGIVWELNYRGDLLFLDQAKAEQKPKQLQIEDGWTYFIHGWTRVIAEVFHIDIPTRGPVFNRLAQIAANFR
jgi:shikimate 5-dehydrogenase